MTDLKQGKVWLVGAGPGDAGLLTIKGKQVLEAAEVVLFDQLIGYGLYGLMPEDAEKINVGKCAGNHPVPQQEINRLLAENALAGKRVVRLKGGDPFLFGRGGEELEYLAAQNISFEVVPGIPSAIGVPAYLGIPVTHRNYCSSLHIITGHGQVITDQGGRLTAETNARKKSTIPYAALVESNGTLVFLMGVTSLSEICEGLLQAGMDPEMPAAVLEQGTTARQRRVIAPLHQLPAAARREAVQAPAVIVVGKVVSLAEKLDWHKKLPLQGVRIGITRPRNRASALKEKLATLGAEVVELPTIQTVPIADTPELKKALEQLTKKDVIAFTSPAGAEVFFMKLLEYQRDIRTLDGVTLAAIGKATAAVLQQRGLIVDLVPPIYNGKSLAEALTQLVPAGGKVLLPRSRNGTEEVLQPLQEQGISFLDIAIYETKYKTVDRAFLRKLTEKKELDWVTFTSASTVEGFVAAWKGEEGAVWPSHFSTLFRALCIGEQTACAARKYKMQTYIAKEATLDSMVATLIEEVLNDGIEKTI